MKKFRIILHYNFAEWAWLPVITARTFLLYEWVVHHALIVAASGRGNFSPSVCESLLDMKFSKSVFCSWPRWKKFGKLGTVFFSITHSIFRHAWFISVFSTLIIGSFSMLGNAPPPSVILFFYCKTEFFGFIGHKLRFGMIF